MIHRDHRKLWIKCYVLRVGATGDIYKEKYFKILTSNIYIYIHAQTKKVIYNQKQEQ